jgi:hypothetical protein
MPPQSSSEAVTFSQTFIADDDIDTCQSDVKVQERAGTRSVKFSTCVEVHHVLHHRDMSADEINSAWMNCYDKKESRQILNSTVYLMKTGAGAKLTEDDYFCSRGLEYLVDDSRTERIKKSHRIALAMQRLLRRSGAYSPEMIARAYRAYTFKSQRAAYRKALHDRSACR